MEYLLHREIRAAGETAWMAPRVVVAHQDWSQLTRGLRANACVKRFSAAGAGFGTKPWSLPRRLFYVAAMVVAPGLHLWRLGWSFRNRPALWGPFVAALPVCVVVFCYASWFEALGYVAGAGSAEDEFLEVELSAPRQTT